MISYLPIALFISVGWFLSEPVSLFAICVLTLWLLIGVVLKANSSWCIGVGQFSLLAIVGLYTASFLINSNNFEIAFVGNYHRNFGIWYFMALALLFITAANSHQDLLKTCSTLFALLIVSLVYGSLQIIGIDPIPWVNGLDAVQLTLGNPNFAGALLGMLIVVPITKLIEARVLWKRISYGFVVLLTLFLCFHTKSLQAFVVAIFSSLVYYLIFSKSAEEISYKVFRLSTKILLLSTSVAMFFVVFSNIKLFDVLRNALYFQGSIPQRLDYWRTGIEMFSDNWILGVGPDQFQRHAALYRNSEQVVRDGDFVIPDRAHNVLIDHLANGGFGAGILWIGFCFFIFYRLNVISKGVQNRKERNLIGLFGGIWTGYFIQSLLSPDQILLSVIGFMAAGFIVHISKNKTLVSTKTGVNSSFLLDPIYVRLIFGSVLVFAIFFWVQTLSADIAGKRILDGETLDPISIEKGINNWTSPKLIEKITFAVSQADTNCQYVPLLADRLIESDDRSASGWYFKAVCSNLNRDFDKALEYVGKSLSFDPINPVFLVAQAKLAIAAGNKEVGTKALSTLKKEYPDNPEIPLIESSLTFL